MKNLNEATNHICDLKGSVVALHAALAAIIESMPPDRRLIVLQKHEAMLETARTQLLHAAISELTIAAFERDAQLLSASFRRPLDPPASR